VTPAEGVSQAKSGRGPLWLLPSPCRLGHVSAWTDDEKQPGPSWVQAPRNAEAVRYWLEREQRDGGLDEDDAE
jgi:hypothetical protein